MKVRYAKQAEHLDGKFTFGREYELYPSQDLPDTHYTLFDDHSDKFSAFKDNFEPIEVNIRNYATYDHEMCKSMIDKLFFLDKIDAKVLVDYGCADGVLFDLVSTIFPFNGDVYSPSNNAYVGYDIDPQMIADAEKRNIPGSLFTTDWEKVRKFVSTPVSKAAKTCLIANSLLHEVIHYGTPESIAEFWDRMFNTGFDYIVIRDIAYEPELETLEMQDEADTVRSQANAKQVEDFENIWGSLNIRKNLVHFLLKYRYKDNWQREVHENYFANSPADLLAKIPADKYTVAYKEQFALPFNVKTIKRDFGITLDAKTHIKLILEKK